MYDIGSLQIELTCDVALVSWEEGGVSENATFQNVQEIDMKMESYRNIFLEIADIRTSNDNLKLPKTEPL